jgi:hypothetical protein
MVNEAWGHGRKEYGHTGSGVDRERISHDTMIVTHRARLLAGYQHIVMLPDLKISEESHRLDRWRHPALMNCTPRPCSRTTLE